jgi:hypothetical protein
MQTVDETPETIHLYVVREQSQHPSLLPVFLLVLALSLNVAMLIAISILFPLRQPVTRMTLRVPAVPLPPRTFIVQAKVIPPGYAPTLPPPRMVS